MCKKKWNYLFDGIARLIEILDVYAFQREKEIREKKLLNAIHLPYNIISAVIKIHDRYKYVPVYLFSSKKLYFT